MLYYKGNLEALADLKGTAKGLVSAVILFDQFPRSIYRNQPKAFAFDELALGLSHEGIANSFEKDLGVFERAFLYLVKESSNLFGDFL